MLDLIARDASDVGPSRGYQVIVGGSVLTAISTFGMIGRLISARMVKRSVQVDDLLLIFAFSLNIFQFGVLAWATEHAGWGRHRDTLSPQELVYFAKSFLICSFVQPAILMSSKMSLLILLYRIFVVRSFRITVMVFMAIVIAWFVAITFATAFICSPFDSNWGASPANCGNTHVLDYIAPIPWIVTDFGILLIPMPMIRKLKLPLPQKVALTGLFLIGGLTCIISCVRYRYVFFSFDDVTWETMGLAIWQLAESNMTIFCVCLVASRPFALLLIPDVFIESIRSSIVSIQSSRSRSSSGEKRDPSNLNSHPNHQPSTTSSSSEYPKKKSRGVIQKSYSVHLQSIPRAPSEVTDPLGSNRNSTISSTGAGDDFRNMQSRTYSVVIEGGRHIQDEDAFSTPASDESTLGDQHRAV